MINFQQEIIGLLAKETGLKREELVNLVTVPPNPRLGEYAFPCFKLGQNPNEEAKKLKKKLKLPSFLSKTEVAGPYLNFFLNPTFLAEVTLTEISKRKEKYGSGKENKVVVVEFCGPNTNKPLHLGHIRNMAIGSSICNIASFQGKEVHPVNIVNDRGIHICQSMLAYQKWGNNQKPNKKGDHFVGDYYVLFSQKAKEDEKLKPEAQEMLFRWEQGDQKILALWKKMNQWVLSGFKETYQRFGIKFEKEYFESDYFEGGKKLVWEGLGQNLFEKDDKGAIIAHLEKYGLPDKVLLRENNTSVYITQDIHLAQLRYDDYHYDKMIYVVASEQQLHFKQLFKVLELLKKPYAPSLYHLSYGLVNLPSGRMKSREGTVVDADDLLTEITGLAEKEVKARYNDLTEKEINERADFIALAAIKFFMLKTDPFKEMVFNPEESISFEGETGPYLQYTHARAGSILRKAEKEKKIKVSAKVDFRLFQDKEIALIKQLSDFPAVIAKVDETSKPYYLANYLIKLAQQFNEFYHHNPVLFEQKEMMKARLLLVSCTKQVLAIGLNLLGIKAPEKM